MHFYFTVYSISDLNFPFVSFLIHFWHIFYAQLKPKFSTCGKLLTKSANYSLISALQCCQNCCFTCMCITNIENYLCLYGLACMCLVITVIMFICTLSSVAFPHSLQHMLVSQIPAGVCVCMCVCTLAMAYFSHYSGMQNIPWIYFRKFFVHF